MMNSSARKYAKNSVESSTENSANNSAENYAEHSAKNSVKFWNCLALGFVHSSFKDLLTSQKPKNGKNN